MAKNETFCQLQFWPMQSVNTFFSMLRPCSSSAGKFDMDNENGSRGVLQKTSSIKETLSTWQYRTGIRTLRLDFRPVRVGGARGAAAPPVFQKINTGP